MKRKVAIFDLDGKRLFSRLLDIGDDVMFFDSGFGFVTKYQCRLYKWEIREMVKKKECLFCGKDNCQYKVDGSYVCTKCYVVYVKAGGSNRD